MSEPTVYAGGDFSNIGGQARKNIAAIDAATGTPSTWDPSANQSVDALVVSGCTVYAGGWFTSIGGQARNRIAALDAATGLVTAWDPNASYFVGALAVSGSTVYAGGSFTGIGGQGQSRIAAISAAPTIVAVQPARRGNDGFVTVTLSDVNLARAARRSSSRAPGSPTSLGPESPRR